jgi:L-alanine-DL-glutamate epimerase-like enolase superfamily enzyme
VKITDITLESYRWPRHTPIRNGKHVYTHSGVNLVTVQTDEGISGIGLSAAGGDFAQAMTARYKEDLIGENPINVERLWHKMWVPKLTGRRGLTTRVISGIDIALWDLRGKVAGLPLYQLLGGAYDRIPTYIAGGYYEEGKGLRELQREMEENLEMGATAIKMKIGGVSIREDVERVKAVREVIGPDVKLLVDANCAYRVYEAIQIAKRMEEFDPFWFEEPIPPDDYRGHAQIARATSIPIATGENEYTRYGFRDLILSEGVAILNADAKILGGITEFMKVAAFAQAYDLVIAPHGAQEVHVHLVTAVQNGLLLEFYRNSVDPMWGKIYQQTLSLNDDGTVSPPDLPGLGIEPNYDALRPYRVG